MNIISIDLGTTNTKVSVYDQGLHPVAVLSDTVQYRREGDFVEFDCDEYFDSIAGMIQKAAGTGRETNGQSIAQIVLTGQAESLILLDQNGSPVHPAISWMDMRSRKECRQLAGAFPAHLCYETTGQPELIPTWPITKMLWMRENKPEIFAKTAYYLLLKDYIVYRLCGRMAGEYSIYSFSHYFDIIHKCYWDDILSYCGVRKSQLPQLLPPMSVAGTLLPRLADEKCGLTADTRINVGTLDHFAGMIGTGNIREGLVSESAGTVLSIAALVRKPVFNDSRLPINCGPFPETYVLLPVCESGGFSMEWFKNQFLEDVSFHQINQVLESRDRRTPPIFLPYLTGVNAPDFNADASGVFFGLHAGHDKYDMARAVMEGVACLLKKNLDYMAESGIRISKIISTGGGARSPLWTQIKSEITGQPIEVPENEEAPCLGAAIIGAVTEQYFDSFEAAAESCISIKRKHVPVRDGDYQRTYDVFTSLYDALADVYKMNAGRCSD